MSTRRIHITCARCSQRIFPSLITFSTQQDGEFSVNSTSWSCLEIAMIPTMGTLRRPMGMLHATSIQHSVQHLLLVQFVELSIGRYWYSLQVLFMLKVNLTQGRQPQICSAFKRERCVGVSFAVWPYTLVSCLEQWQSLRINTTTSST